MFEKKDSLDLLCIPDYISFTVHDIKFKRNIEWILVEEKL